VSIKIKFDGLKTKTFRVDQQDLTVPEETASQVEKLFSIIKEAAAIIDVLEKKSEELSAQNEQLQAQTDAQDEELKTTKDQLNATQEECQKKCLDEVAKEAKLPEDTMKKDSKTIKIEIIKSRHKEFNAEGKSDEYINARFDAVKELIFSEKKNNEKICDVNRLANEKSRTDNKPKDPREDFLNKCKELNK